MKSLFKKKYYVVWQGNKPGIYRSWDSCKRQVEGFKNSIYKSFNSIQEAEKAYFSNDNFSQHKTIKQLIHNSLSVDASCSGNPGNMEYRGVDTKTEEEKFHIGPYPNGTNNIGEFLAIVHGLMWINTQKNNNIPIYSDSKIAILWVKKKKCNTTLTLQKPNPIFCLIQNAEKWLKTHSYTSLVIKWNTKEWGEIPADFGRK